MRAKSVLVRNAGWLFAGQGLSFVVQAFYFIVLARLLGTTQYGLLAGAVALVAVVSQYSTFGSGLLFLRYVSPDHSRFRLYWGNILMSTLVLGTCSSSASGCPAVGSWAPASVPLLFPIAIGDCLFAQLGSAAGQVFQTFEKMKFSAALTLLGSVSRCLIAVGMLADIRPGVSLAVGHRIAGRQRCQRVRRGCDRDSLLRASVVLAHLF